MTKEIILKLLKSSNIEDVELGIYMLKGKYRKDIIELLERPFSKGAVTICSTNVPDEAITSYKLSNDCKIVLGSLTIFIGYERLDGVLYYDKDFST